MSQAEAIVRGETRSYDAARLRVGIVGIGSVLVWLWFGAVTGLTDRIARLFAPEHSVLGAAVAATTLGLAVSLILLPVDVFGGVIVERRVRRVSIARWLQVYFSGTAGWLVLLGLGGAIAGGSLAAGPNWWQFLTPLTALALLATSTALGAVSVSQTDPLTADETAALRWRLGAMGLALPAVAWARDAGDTYLSGAWSRGTLVLSGACRGLPGRDELVCLVAREIGHRDSKHRRNGIVLAALWAAAVPGLTALIMHPDPDSAPAVVAALAVISSTWVWIGLLVLPTLGQRQVLAADRYFLAHGGSADVLRATLELLASQNRVDRTRSPLVERIFHPIPSLERRLEAISQ